MSYGAMFCPVSFKVTFTSQNNPRNPFPSHPHVEVLRHCRDIPGLSVIHPCSRVSKYTKVTLTAPGYPRTTNYPPSPANVSVSLYTKVTPTVPGYPWTTSYPPCPPYVRVSWYAKVTLTVLGYPRTTSYPPSSAKCQSVLVHQSNCSPGISLD